MQTGFIRILSAITGKSKRILDTGCILFCFVMLFSMAGCSAGKDKIEATNKAGDNSFSVKNLDFCKVSDKESCRLISIDSANNTLAVSVFIYSLPISANTSREIVLLYDMNGTLQSQINVLDMIGSDKVFVDQAIDASGNLAVLARAQGDDNVIRNYLYSFDSAGKLAGDPIELTFGESILPSNFVIRTDGYMFFGDNQRTGMSVGHQIDVYDSKGNMVFVIANSRIVGNLYQTGDMIYTDGNISGTNAANTTELIPINSEPVELGDSIDISKVTSSGGAVCAGSDGFYLINVDGIYSVNLDSQVTKELILWKNTNTDLNTGMFNVFPAAVISSDKIFLFSSKSSAVDGTAAIKVSLLTRK